MYDPEDQCGVFKKFPSCNHKQQQQCAYSADHLLCPVSHTVLLSVCLIFRLQSPLKAIHFHRCSFINPILSDKNAFLLLSMDLPAAPGCFSDFPGMDKIQTSYAHPAPSISWSCKKDWNRWPSSPLRKFSYSTEKTEKKKKQTSKWMYKDKCASLCPPPLQVQFLFFLSLHHMVFQIFRE